MAVRLVGKKQKKQILNRMVVASLKKGGRNDPTKCFLSFGWPNKDIIVEWLQVFLLFCKSRLNGVAKREETHWIFSALFIGLCFVYNNRFNRK